MKRAMQTLKRQSLEAAVVRPRIRWSAGTLLILALSGCASLPAALVDTVNVERLDSPRANIRSVYVGDNHGLLLVRGRLEKRRAGRSPIPGHLHIEVLGKDGLMLGQEMTRYYQRSRKSGISGFAREFSVPPGDVRTVRIIHHVGEDKGVGCAARREHGAERAAVGFRQVA